MSIAANGLLITRTAALRRGIVSNLISRTTASVTKHVAFGRTSGHGRHGVGSAPAWIRKRARFLGRSCRCRTQAKPSETLKTSNMACNLRVHKFDATVGSHPGLELVVPTPRLETSTRFKRGELRNCYFTPACVRYSLALLPLWFSQCARRSCRRSLYPRITRSTSGWRRREGGRATF